MKLDPPLSTIEVHADGVVCIFQADGMERKPDGSLRVYRFGRAELEEDWDEGTIALFDSGVWRYAVDKSLTPTDG